MNTAGTWERKQVISALTCVMSTSDAASTVSLATTQEGC